MLSIRRSAAVAARFSHQISAAPRALVPCVVNAVVACGPARHSRPFSLTARLAVDESPPVLKATQSPPAHENLDTDAPSQKTPKEYPGYGFAEPVALKARSVFVSNAPIDAKESDIKEYFEHVAPVEFVCKGPTALYYWVYFKDAETAQRVQEKMDNTFWLGRMLRVKPRIIKTQAPGPGHLMNPSATLFVGNMPFTMTDADLNNLSKRLEYSFDIRVAVDRASGWPRGYCHADFYNAALATRALYKSLVDPIEMGSNRLRLNFAAAAKGKNYDFDAARRKALMYSHRSVSYYDDLADQLREEEGEWNLTAEMLQAQPGPNRAEPPTPMRESYDSTQSSQA